MVLGWMGCVETGLLRVGVCDLLVNVLFQCRLLIYFYFLFLTGVQWVGGPGGSSSIWHR